MAAGRCFLPRLKRRQRPENDADEPGGGSEVVLTMHITFSSKVSKESRQALEALMFFNPEQFRVKEGIVSALHKFGHPRIEETAEGLSIRVADLEAQTLFAFDHVRYGTDPVGVVAFIRTAPEEIAIMHIAVQQDYTMQGCRAGLGLSFVLIEKIREIALRIVGVKQLIFFYRKDWVMRL